MQKKVILLNLSEKVQILTNTCWGQYMYLIIILFSVNLRRVQRVFCLTPGFC